VAVALGDLVHHGGRARAVAERLHLPGDVLPRQAGERSNLLCHAAAFGAVAVGAGRGEAARGGTILRSRSERRRGKRRGDEQSVHGSSPRRGYAGAREKQRPPQATGAGSSSKASLIFSSSPMSMVTLPPCCSRPNS